MNDVSPETTGQRKVRTSLALALLEAIRHHDFPPEVLEDENLSLTLPRRLGLSDVVDEQIRRYRKVGRRRSRIPAKEFGGLVRLVARRPDAKAVFFDVGRGLAPARGIRLWSRVIPDRGMQAVRGRVARCLKGFFGETFLSARRGSPALESVDALLVEADPRGGACALVTGIMQGAIERAGLSARASHVTCVVRGEEACSWDIESIEVAGASDAPSRRGVSGRSWNGGRGWR